VPLARGPERSRPLADVLDEAVELQDRGFREIVVTGIHLGAWGHDLAPQRALPDLLEALLRRAPAVRLRASSLEPMEVTPALLALMAAERRLCPHLHLPLQSGADAILRAMNRPYTAAAYAEKLAAVREALPDPGITTDVMVGFPGESEDDFAATVAACRAARFSRMHVFPYSPRPGTPAAALPGRPPGAVVRRREKELAALGRGMADAFARGRLGRRAQVVAEKAVRGGRRTGTTGRYLKVVLEGVEAAPGELVEVALVRMEEGLLVGVAPRTGT